MAPPRIEKIITALDVGSWKVCALIAGQTADGQLHVLGTGQRESRGVQRGYVADTVEISGRWSEIGGIYDDSIAALNQIPGVINASAHSSHVYRSGINLYFSFAATFEDSAKMEPAYFAGWRAIMA